MKKNIYIISLMIVFVGCIVASSCTKKHEDEDHTVGIEYSYTPQIIKKDSLITFTFTVKDNGTNTDVTSPAWSVKSGPSTNNILSSLTKMSTGVFTGTCKLTAVGTYNMNMNCMHDGMMQNKDFTLTVQ